MTPVYKRIAAILGDLEFEASRRFFLEHRADKQDIWVYGELRAVIAGDVADSVPSVHKRRKDTKVIGAAHTADLMDMFGPSDMTTRRSILCGNMRALVVVDEHRTAKTQVTNAEQESVVIRRKPDDHNARRTSVRDSEELVDFAIPGADDFCAVNDDGRA